MAKFRTDADARPNQYTVHKTEIEMQSLAVYGALRCIDTEHSSSLPNELREPGIWQASSKPQVGIVFALNWIMSADWSTTANDNVFCFANNISETTALKKSSSEWEALARYR